MFFNFFENIFKKQVSEEELYSCAQKAFENKEYEQTLEFLNEVIKIHPAAKYFAFIGNVYYNQNKYNSAVNAYIQAVNTNRYCDEYYEKLASIYHECDRDGVALEYIQKALKYNPNEINYKILLADILNSMGNITDAKIIYKDLLNCLGNNDDKYCEILNKLEKLNEIQTQEYSEQYEKSADDYYEKGQKYLEEKKYEDAVKCFETAINLDPNDADNYYWCGKAKYYNGQNKEALKDLTTGIKLIPDDICYYYSLRGDINKSLAKYNAAKKNYLKAINEALEDFDIDNVEEKITEIDEILAEKYFEKGQKYFDKEKYEDSIKYFEESKNLAPDDDNYIYWCGYAKYWNDQDEGAIKDFDKAIELNPLPKYYYYRGHSKYFLERYEEAIEDYKIGIGKNPENLYDYYKLMAEAKKGLGDITGAIEVYKYILENDSNEENKIEIQEKITELKQLQSQNNDVSQEGFEESEQEIEDEDQYEKSAEEYYNEGQTYLEEKKYEDAIKCFEVTIKLEPDDADNYYWCALAKYKNGQNKEALKDLASGIKLLPEDICCYYNLRGDINKDLNKYEAARKNYLKAISEADEDFDIDKVQETLREIDEIQAQDYYDEGQTYLKEKKYEDAIKCFEKSKNLAPDDDNYIYWCGYAKYWNDQDEEAIKDFNWAIELNPDSENYYCYRGHAKFYIGEYENAIEDYKTGMSKNPENLYDYYEYIADAKKELGDIVGAIDDYKYALENNPDEEEKIKIQEKILELETSQGKNNINPKTSEEIEQTIAAEDQSEDLCIDVKDTSSKKEIIETESTKIKEAEYYYNRGKIYYQNQHNNLAKNNFFKAIGYNSNISEYYYWFVLASINLGQIGDQQLKYIQKAIELDNKKSEYYYLSAKINYKQKNFEIAFDEINKAIELNGNDSKYYVLKADINKDLGDNEQSKVDYEQAEKLKIVKYINCEQKDIFEAAKDKSFLVDAGPGTGKTFTLIQKIKYLVNEEKIPEESILVLSHTNAAVDEIKNRLKNISEDTGIKVHKINIRTICSFVKYAHSKIDEFINKNKDEKDKTYFKYEATENGFSKANKRLIERLHYKIYDYDINVLLNELKVEYLVVDEIQDATDSVGKIICKLLKGCVNSNIPFALFGDKCQAIFDYDKNDDKNKKSKQNKNEQDSLKSTEFYYKIETLLKNRDNVDFVSLNKNMRQTEVNEEWELYRENLNKYRKAILNNDNDKCEEYLMNIKKESPDYISTENISSIQRASHCIITHSNNRALYIASKLQKQGIPVLVRTKDNKIQFEYHEWIAKILNNKWNGGYIIYEDFEKFVIENQINLPTNYESYNEQNNIKTFFEYLNTEFLGNDYDTDISVNTLFKKIYYEFKCDNILKVSTLHNLNNREFVEVSTIHKAKGREFDFVHIDSGCCDGDYFEDKYKSMYVALTRPKHCLDFVDFEMKDFTYSQKLVNKWNNIHKFKKIDLLYITNASKKLKQYKVLYNDIDLVSFKYYQKELNNLRINDEIIIYNECDSWIITHNNQKIGEMKTTFIGNMTKNVIPKYGKLMKITGLRIDGIWTVFEKDSEDGDIKAWNVVSFCGFGDVEY